MVNQNLSCSKCNQILNYLPYHSYAEPPAMKSKEGKFYCFDCFKSVSSCKVCGKSVAQMEINIHDKKTWYQPWEKIYWREAGHIKPFDMCGRYCDFLCSPECFAKDENRNHKLRKRQNKAKLAQGWKHCEECVELFRYIWDITKLREKKFYEKNIIYHAKVLPPGEKICELHKRWKEKDAYIKQVIYPKAQKWWDNLTYGEKLAEVRRLDINWIIGQNDKEGKKATHEEVARHPEVPPFIISQEFELKEPCISCGKVWKCGNEINCGNANPNGKTSYCASCPSGNRSKNGSEGENKNNPSGLISEMSEIEQKKLQLQELKKQGGNSKTIRKLEKEIQELVLKSENKPNNPFTFSSKSLLAFFSIIAVSSAIIISLVVKIKSKKAKTKL